MKEDTYSLDFLPDLLIYLRLSCYGTTQDTVGEGDRVTKPSGGSALGWIRGGTIGIERDSL